MSRVALPKQLIPFIQGKSLLELAFDRLDGLIPQSRRYVCAGQSHRNAISAALHALPKENFLGEPVGRDTLNAIGLGAALLHAKDRDAVFAVLTADHLIEPVDQFRSLVEQGFALVEREPQTLVTFGIAPTGPATGYGYLELGDQMPGGGWTVKRFKEKPAAAVAEEYFKKGPDHYLWNSGMFVWSAATVLQCIRMLASEVFAGLMQIAEVWDTPRRESVVSEIYPTLKKISVDFAIMEPVTREEGLSGLEGVRVAAIPMDLRWKDVGSWPSFAETCPHDENGNALAAEKHVLSGCSNCLVASDQAEHLVVMMGCKDLMVIHSKEATLICPADKAEQIKDLHNSVTGQFGGRFT
jgi:mannose-1-phosphate guanylyltransferase